MRTYRAELLRSANRGTASILAVCLAFAVFSMSNAGPQHEPPLWGFQQAAIFVATLLMGRAATVAAGDFSGGTIRAWIISAPSRGPVFLGKLAASISVALGASAVAGLTAYAVSGVFGTVPALAGMAGATGRLAVAAVGFTVFGHAVGVTTRSVPVALAVTIGWVLPAEAVLKGRSTALDPWLPGSVFHDLTLGHGDAGAALHAALPFVVLDVVALVLFLRRDIGS
jgi:hypothetical protein